MPSVAKHEDGDYILDDNKAVNLQEKKNCGCGRNPCKHMEDNRMKITRNNSNKLSKKSLKLFWMKDAKKAIRPMKSVRPRQCMEKLIETV